MLSRPPHASPSDSLSKASWALSAHSRLALIDLRHGHPAVEINAGAEIFGAFSAEQNVPASAPSLGLNVSSTLLLISPGQLRTAIAA